jgi:hypothetical protein
VHYLPHQLFDQSLANDAAVLARQFCDSLRDRVDDKSNYRQATGGFRMCGRFTVKATWTELVALYRLTMDAPPHNLRPRYNVCPTDPVDVVTAEEGKRELVPMRWGLIPRWWSKTIKDATMATFNARAETVETKPFFRDRVQTFALPYPNVWVLRVARHARWKAALVFHGAWLTTSDSCRPLGRVERPADRRAAQVMHDDHHRTERFRHGNPRSHAAVFDGAAIRAVAERGGGCRVSEACSERLSATLAGIEEGQ